MRLIIDTDAGVDDSQAIMMALTQPGVSVEAITTLTGNTHVNWVTRNVSATLDVMQADVPIYRGAERPLIPGYWEPVDLMGNDGLGNYQNRPQQDRPLEAEHAVKALIRLVNESPGEYTIVALGPMTNLALACHLDPDFPQKVGQLVFMGGTIAAMGNTRNLTAEYNMYVDPEAALVVLDRFPASSMVSWETTVQHGFSWADYDALAALETPAGRFFRETGQTTADFLRGLNRDGIGYLLPDPLAMAITLDPALIRASDHRYVTMEVQGAQTRGQTIIDHLGTTGKTPNVHIITQIDTGGVYRLFERMLS
ncbi:MAG: nucleoside hydrolase [Anaerolineae bacterium]|nr:nucleoside hydrolase [Anaerolineae bacterium]